MIYNPTKTIKDFDTIAQELIDDAEYDHPWVFQKLSGKPLADKLYNIYAQYPIVKSLTSHEIPKLKLSLIKHSTPLNRLKRIAFLLKSIN